MKKGQTILEYMILLGIVVLAIFYMGPAFKRGLQSLIKVTADQIGNQSQADQVVKRGYNEQTNEVIVPDDGEDDAFLAEAHSSSKVTGNKLMRDYIYATTVEVNETTDSASKSITDMGFTKQ